MQLHTWAVQICKEINMHTQVYTHTHISIYKNHSQNTYIHWLVSSYTCSNKMHHTHTHSHTCTKTNIIKNYHKKNLFKVRNYIIDHLNISKPWKWHVNLSNSGVTCALEFSWILNVSYHSSSIFSGTVHSISFCTT